MRAPVFELEWLLAGLRSWKKSEHSQLTLQAIVEVYKSRDPITTSGRYLEEKGVEIVFEKWVYASAQEAEDEIYIPQNIFLCGIYFTDFTASIFLSSFVIVVNNSVSI